ncbi:cation acetate symporter [Nonomuraea rosea]|uniref:Cation acetate symporter n=1 Tax=Nonomuraea rosea TaxID=638574 RepID=A0ABP6ZJG1_9ACTN
MIFSLIILLVVSRFGRARNTCSDFYAGDRTFTSPQNGLALFGTFMTMTSFLTLSDEIAVNGYDGVLFAASFAVSWLVTLLLVAEPLRNTGRYTLGDALSVRMKEGPVRVAGATVTLVVFFFYMTIQLIGAGSFLALLLGLDGPLGQGLVIATIGGLTAVTVCYGGMRATTWTQIINAVLLFAAVVVLAGALLVRYRFDVSTLLADAAKAAPEHDLLLTPGAKFGHGPHRLEFVSQLLTVVLGYAALPYLFIRYLTVPHAKDTRRSVSWAICLSTPFYLLIILIGFGAAAMIGLGHVPFASGQRLSVAPLLAFELGGLPLLALVASVIFTTIIAVTAGLALSAAAGFTRDIYANVIRRGPLDERHEITVARRTVVILCVLLTVCAILLMGQNLTFMLSLDVTLAASSILPPLLLAWFWRGFNTAGTLWSLYGGAAVTVVLVAFSPAVSGDPLALFPTVDFAWFPWKYVGLISIPMAFLLGYAGAKLSGDRDDAKYAEMEVRALTGAGAVEALPRDAGEPPGASGITGAVTAIRRMTRAGGLPWNRRR